MSSGVILAPGIYDDTKATRRTDRWVALADFEVLEGEQWLPVEGFERYGFEVSDQNRIRHIKGGLVHLLHPNPNENGYLKVNLYVGSACNTHRFHILVAKAFVHDRRPDQTCVNHIDNDRTNCRADNLEWCTHKENMEHARRLGKTWHRMSAETRATIVDMLEQGMSGFRIAHTLGIQGSTVYRVRNQLEAAHAPIGDEFALVG